MHQMVFFSLSLFSFSMVLIPFGIYFCLYSMTFIFEWEMFNVGLVSVEVSAVFDYISLFFSSIVLLISSSVMWFSVGYMSGEYHMKRFTWLVFLFVVSMNILIYSSNLVALLLGWDGLGLTSFLLVIYYQNAYSLGAGLITVLTNRLGDVMLILSIGLMMGGGHWFIPSLEVGAVAGALVLIGAMTKSAQFPFSSWLPMAMAAPTPVSALVHSSTLVTAGVYLVIRFYEAVESYGVLASGLSLMSSLTMVLAGFAAIVESDFKKVIAYSTLSQLGVMMLALGLGSPMLAFFHLVCHAMFKALMFICAGECIHYHKHMQDLRVMGSLGLSLPVVQVGVFVSSLSLCGFPFLAGFYSKDPIYELSIGSVEGVMISFMMVLGLALTSLYSARSVMISQMAPSNQLCLMNLNSESGFFLVPIMLLGSFAVFFGSLLNWVLPPPLFLGGVSLWLGVVPLVCFLVSVGVYSGVFPSSNGQVGLEVGKVSAMLHDGFFSIWFLSFMSAQSYLGASLKGGGSLISVVDQGWVEMVSGQGGVSMVSSWLKVVRSMGHIVSTYLILVGIGGLLFSLSV